MKASAILLLTFAVLSSFGAGKEVLDLSKVKKISFSGHINEKRVSAIKGAGAKVTANGIELTYKFATKGHDACMVEFPVQVKAFKTITIELTADKKGHRPFFVLTDKNGENHYFSMVNNIHINAQAIRRKGRQRFSSPIRIKNSHPGERFAFRWGGDGNQRIDFPIKKLMLGLNDYPDEKVDSGKIIFHKVTFQ